MWSHGKPAHCSPGTPLSCHPANLSIQKGSNRYPMRPNMAKPCSMNVPCSVMMCKMLHDFCAPGILRLQFRRARPWTFCSASKGVTIGIIGVVKELIRIGNCSRRTEIKKEWFNYIFSLLSQFCRFSSLLMISSPSNGLKPSPLTRPKSKKCSVWGTQTR